MTTPLLKNKVALVTGGSRGIGRASAHLFAQEGATVWIGYRHNAEAAEQVVEEIKKTGGMAYIIQADVAEPGDVKRMFDTIDAQCGQIDILLTSAGILKNNLLLSASVEEFDMLMRTNVRGTFLCVQAALKRMIKQKAGSIITLSSVVAKDGSRGQAAYAASKAAVAALTKSVAKEGGAFGVRANVLAPGFIETDMTNHLVQSHKISQEILNGIALGRFGTSEEVAQVALFLASQLSGYVSGQVIGVDGFETL